MKTWKWKLGIEDRVALRTLLMQSRGSRAEQALSDKIIDNTLSNKEVAELNIRAEGNNIVWNLAGADGKPIPLDKEVEFGPEARTFITRNLALLDEACALERMMTRLYDLFLNTPWPEPD